jgi:hypothetical protein
VYGSPSKSGLFSIRQIHWVLAGRRYETADILMSFESVASFRHDASVFLFFHCQKKPARLRHSGGEAKKR